MLHEIKSYEQQANDFAAKHGIKLTSLDCTFGKYFPDDKQGRYIFKMRLTRNKKTYTFNFGQSIAAGEKQPTMYDILTCLTKYDPETFEDFYANYGYDDEDSRSAYSTYKAVCEEWQAVERLFGDILDELQEIQ